MRGPGATALVAAASALGLSWLGAPPALGAVGGAALGIAVGWVLARRPAPPSEPAPEATDRTDLLQAVLEAQPFASVLFTDGGRIVFANGAARDLFFEGDQVEGQDFLGMLAAAPAPLREALTCAEDRVFAVDAPGGTESFFLARRAVTLAGAPHVLLMVTNLTRAFSRQELAVWKRAIRLMSHEVNNSLAPVSSLMHSARLLAQGTEAGPRLLRVFDTVEERARHLTQFLDGYAAFARLPPPSPRPVAWRTFLESVGRLYPQLTLAPPPEGEGWFDEAQLSQVVINLVKNALEAGGPRDAVELRVAPSQGGFQLSVLDRGQGVSAEVAQFALLPFYTTKEGGAGLGLALCREVVEAHRGSIRLEAREGGGAAAVVWLPPVAGPEGAGRSRARLTVTHGG